MKHGEELTEEVEIHGHNKGGGSKFGNNVWIDQSAPKNEKMIFILAVMVQFTLRNDVGQVHCTRFVHLFYTSNVLLKISLENFFLGRNRGSISNMLVIEPRLLIENKISNEL